MVFTITRDMPFPITDDRVVSLQIHEKLVLKANLTEAMYAFLSDALGLHLIGEATSKQEVASPEVIL